MKTTWQLWSLNTNKSTQSGSSTMNSNSMLLYLSRLSNFKWTDKVSARSSYWKSLLLLCKLTRETRLLQKTLSNQEICPLHWKMMKLPIFSMTTTSFHLWCRVYRRSKFNLRVKRVSRLYRPLKKLRVVELNGVWREIVSKTAQTFRHLCKIQSFNRKKK